MSEYQYYEFRAIDRPLDRKQQEELRALSTRAEITPTSFTNTYHWGDFKGDPSRLMQRYFDAFVYVANWGTNRLMFRIPRRLLDLSMVGAYCCEDVVSLDVGAEYVVIEFASNDESGREWTEGGPWMPSLISIRDELMRGDFRALYLGWLASFSERGRFDDDPDADGVEPPVPPGLATLSASQGALAQFLRVDEALLEAAAAGSVDEAPSAPSGEEMARWVETIPIADRNAYLLRFLAEEGDVPLRAELMKRFRESTARRSAGGRNAARPRTVAQLIALRAEVAENRRRRAAVRAASEKARHERELAEARTKRLNELAAREADAWKEVERRIATRLPREYDQAVALLVDLRDLADREDRGEQAAERILAIRKRNSNKPSLIKRFVEHKLGD